MATLVYLSLLLLFYDETFKISLDTSAALAMRTPLFLIPISLSLSVNVSHHQQHLANPFYLRQTLFTFRATPIVLFRLSNLLSLCLCCLPGMCACSLVVRAFVCIAAHILYSPLLNGTTLQLVVCCKIKHTLAVIQHV
jgi:hypothetical protein